MKAIVAIDDDTMELKWLKRCHEQARVTNPLVLFQTPSDLMGYVFESQEPPRPGVILVDIRMPTSGFDVVRNLQLRGCDAKLHLFTTSAHPDDLSRARDLGVEFSRKPEDRATAIEFMKSLAKELDDNVV